VPGAAPFDQPDRIAGSVAEVRVQEVFQRAGVRDGCSEALGYPGKKSLTYHVLRIILAYR